MIGGDILSKRAKQLIMFLIICIVLITLLYDKNNIVISVLYITIGCISQYDLINILKTHNKISSKERKINIIVGSIILWILILLFSSKYLYNILQS
jgi:dolichol kinase